MDSFEWNKILGAVLGTALFIAGLNILVDEFMKPEKPTTSGMTVAVTEAPTGGTPAAETKPDWGTVLPVADVAAGEKVHQRCLQCHDFEKGGPNKIGPNLYGVVGNKRAHEPTYSYSSGMQSAGGTWGYDELDAFLASPRAVIQGTKMTFAGLSKQQDRVDLIAWLRTKADSPFALPPPHPAAANAPAAGGGPDGESPTTQTQSPQPGEKPQPTAPGAAPPTAPTGGVPPASTTPAPAKPEPASGPAPAPTPATPPATPPGH
jgi:cytochrome c